jgi:transcriptional regulator with GAF, ATPase, and Fis domain
MPNLDAARLFANVAQDLMTQPDLAATHERIVSMAVKLTGCTSAAILTVPPSAEVRITAGTDPLLIEPLSRIAAETGQGPTMQALRGRRVVAASLSNEGRWPAYARRVLAETEIRSEAAYPLQMDGADFGVLSLHSVEHDHFSDDLCAVAEIYASHALMALLHAKERHKATHLEIGLVSNREIGTAIGVLMTSCRITDQQAFDMLRIASQHHHRKLRDVAAEVALTGQLPADVLPRVGSERPRPGPALLRPRVVA